MTLIPQLPMKSWWMLCTVCTITFNIGMEVQSLPNSYRAMEVDLDVSAAALSWLFMYETLAFTIAVPIFLNLVESGIPRKQLLLIGTASWATCTLLLAFTRSYWLNVLLRTASGISLAVVWPVAQANVLENTEASTRGFAFGLFFCAFSVGQVFSCLFFLPLSERLIGGIHGWRFALFAVGILRAVIVMAVKFFVQEGAAPVWRPERLGLSKEIQRIGNVLLIPTFGVIAVQSIIEYVAVPAGGMNVVFFQYSGLNDQIVAFINTLYMLGGGLGSLVGGLIGDSLYKYSAKYGRALTGQLAYILCLPCTILLYNADPAGFSSQFIYGTLQFMNGFVNFALTACVCPIIADVVQEFTYGLVIYNGIGIATGLPIGNALLSGMLHARGYQATTAVVNAMDPSRRATNLAALRQVIPTLQIAVTIFNIIALGCTCLTYHRDYERLRDATAKGNNELDVPTSTYGSTEAQPLL